jgi:antitoxin component YwqK of YwqJK toxin-antitoxin module
MHRVTDDACLAKECLMKIYFLRLRLAMLLAACLGLPLQAIAQEREAGEKQLPAAVVDATLAAQPSVVTEAKAADAVAPANAIELVQERYPSGAIKIEREMALDAEGNYVPHGAWRYYDEQGRLFIDGRFEKGQREGIWRRFYRGNEVSLLATMPYKEFAAPLISSTTFHVGKLHGTWTITDALHRKVHEIELRDGVRHGLATWYYPGGGEFMRGNYQNGLPNGEIVHLSTAGEVVEKELFESGRQLATRIDYLDAKQQIKKQEVSYLHAPLAVKTADNWDTCVFATLDSHGKDERHGPFSVWHANGQLARQGEFEHDVLTGKLTAWHSNGQTQFEGQYADGKLDGVWTWWHFNGQKAITGRFQESVAVGPWSWWTAAGDLARRTDFSKEGPVVTAPADDSIRSARLQVEGGLPMR